MLWKSSIKLGHLMEKRGSLVKTVGQAASICPCSFSSSAWKGEHWWYAALPKDWRCPKWIKTGIGQLHDHQILDRISGYFLFNQIHVQRWACALETEQTSLSWGSKSRHYLCKSWDFFQNKCIWALRPKSTKIDLNLELSECRSARNFEHTRDFKIIYICRVNILIQYIYIHIISITLL